MGAEFPARCTRRAAFRWLMNAVVGTALLTGCRNREPDRFIRSMKGADGSVFSVDFAPGGQSVVSGTEGHMIRQWRVADGAVVHTFVGHTGAVYGTAFLQNGAMLATASRDQTVRLWRVADGMLLATLIGHTDSVEKSRLRRMVASWPQRPGTGRSASGV